MNLIIRFLLISQILFLLSSFNSFLHMVRMVITKRNNKILMPPHLSLLWNGHNTILNPRLTTKGHILSLGHIA